MQVIAALSHHEDRVLSWVPTSGARPPSPPLPLSVFRLPEPALLPSTCSASSGRARGSHAGSQAGLLLITQLEELHQSSPAPGEEGAVPEALSGEERAY
ncbi:hypothetical protein NDU88_007065 [Pleurodeles waltl]|uniref:Uncharacterized protein n=1 Tax=Pleurodeles waltl TaxID=8319 RepID=A0AAV7WF34_PLEWA|nr:hypothetical protein NDU88_007065 [Pleurodeles waltl]